MSGATAVHHGAFGRAALYDLDRSIITHAHREGHLVFHVSGDRARLQVGERSAICDPVQAVAINPWEPHSFNTIAEGECCCCLVLYISQSWFVQMARSASPALNFATSAIHVTPQIERMVNRLISLLMDARASKRVNELLFELTRLCHAESHFQRLAAAGMEPGMDAAMDAGIAAAMGERIDDLRHGYAPFKQPAEIAPDPRSRDRSAGAARQIDGTDPRMSSPRMPPMPGRPLNDFRVRRSVRLMEQNLIEDLEIDHLAREVGLSRPHFFKLFKMQMGITPNLYMNTLRTEQAIRDLMVTDKSVTDIGFDLGFSSQASFTRFFASNVGIPPTEYRRVAHIA